MSKLPLTPARRRRRIISWSALAVALLSGVVVAVAPVLASGLPPTAVLDGPYVIAEGDVVWMSAVGSTDPEGDPLVPSWDIDNDGVYDLDSHEVIFTWDYFAENFGIDDEGTYPISIRVSDGTGEDFTSTTLTIVNAAPEVEITGSGRAVDGYDYEVTLDATDPGADTVTAWTLNWGDGMVDSGVGLPATVTHVYNGDGLVRDITASVTDEDGTWISGDVFLPYFDDPRAIGRHDPNTGMQTAFTQLGVPVLSSPRDVVVGPDGLLYVSSLDNDSILRFDPADNSYIDTVISGGGLSLPKGIAFGRDGNLYVVSSATSEVRRYSSADFSFIDVFASTGLVDPSGIVFGPDGDIYVADQASGYVMRFEGVTGASMGIFADLGVGSVPTDLTFTSGGSLLVTDFAGSSIEEFDGTSGAYLGAVANSPTLAGPTSLTIGPDGAIWVTDYSADQVLRLSSATGALLDVRVDELPPFGPMATAFSPSHQVLVVPSAVVNSTGDSGDLVPGDDSCNTGGAIAGGAPECTLRAALEEANASSIINDIVFEIPEADAGYVTGPPSYWSIQPASQLPATTGTVTIDGFTQPGASRGTHQFPSPIDAVMKIEINGDLALASGIDGLAITGTDSIVSGLVINGFVSGGGSHGLVLSGSDNTAEGMFVGTDITGTVARGNDGNGIMVNGQRNTTGGTTPGAGNLLSGNNSYGLWMSATDPVAQGNIVGLDASGTLPLANAGSGLGVIGGDGARVGGVGAAGNLIGSNAFRGVWVSSVATDVAIQGNWVGLDVTGTVAMNGGITGLVVNSPNALVGGSDPGEGNVVSGNGQAIYAGGVGMRILGNFIGTQGDGTGLVSNTGPGVGVATTNVKVGGTAAGEGNVITNSNSDGVNTSAGASVTILGNSIFGNGVVAGNDIDLNNDGLTANDPGDGDIGTNDLLNFPESATALVTGGTVTVDFALDVPAGTYRVEAFTNPSGAHSSGNGGGETFVGAQTVVHTGAGAEPFSLAFAGSAGDVVTLTATQEAAGPSYGFTSEFSTAVTAVANDTVEVNSTGDAADASPGDGLCETPTPGECTLRAAIEEANASPAIDQVVFDVPTSDAGHVTGVWTTSPLTALPPVAATVTLDATTQPGWVDRPVFVVDGAGDASGASGIRVQAPDVLVRGLSLINSQQYGVEVGASGDRFVLEQSWVGLDPDGTTVRPAVLGGVRVFDDGDDVAIGTPGRGNLISGNGGTGIATAGARTIIQGNILGLDVSGLLPRPSASYAISVSSLATNAQIGGLTVAERNIIGSAGALAIRVNGPGVVLEGNRLGMATDGTVLFALPSDGIRLAADGLNARVGGSVAGANVIAGAASNGIQVASGATGQTIAHNIITQSGDHGIVISASGSATMLANSVSSSGGIAIDIVGGVEGADSVTANDPLDSDAGTNDLLNFPVLTQVVTSGPNLLIDFDLDVPAGTYRVEFFGNSAADASGHGEMETYLGGTSVIHPGGGLQSFSASVVAAPTILSATTTQELAGPSYGYTSEVSATMASPTLALVNSVGDLGDLTPGDDICDTGSTITGGLPECTLRAALEELNDAASSIDTVRFDIPADQAVAGVWTITPASVLPAVQSTVNLDATSQPGWTGDPVVALSLLSLSGGDDGLIIWADNSVVRGLAIVGSPDDGMDIDADGVVVGANWFGVHPDGTTIGNAGGDIALRSADATVIGGSPADKNVFAAAGSRDGVNLYEDTNTIVSYNHFGVDSTGTVALGGFAEGLAISGTASGSVVANNQFGGFPNAAITVNDDATDILVTGNIVGTNSAETVVLPAGQGLWILTSGTVTVENNVIAHSLYQGIRVDEANTGPISILGNRIWDSDYLGIDYALDFHTANDSPDVDGVLNHPVLSQAVVQGSIADIDLTLDTSAGTYRVEFFTNPSGADATGYGEGELFMGAVSVNHPGGSAVHQLSLPGNAGAVLSATLTEDFGAGSFGRTSEFSNSIVMVLGAALTVGDQTVRRSDVLASGGLIPATSAGVAGVAQAFGGGTEMLVGPALNVFGSELTVSGWVNATTLATDAMVIARTAADGTVLNELLLDAATGDAVGRLRLGAVTHEVRSGGGALGAWQHLAMTWDGVDLVLYLDGAEVDRTAAAGSLVQDTTARTTVGNNITGTAGLAGLADHVQMLHRSVSADELALTVANVLDPAAFIAVGVQETAAAQPWSVSGVETRSGSFALAAPSGGGGAPAWAVATGIDEPGLHFESWWWVSTNAVELAATTRAGLQRTDGYEASFTAGGWALQQRIGPMVVLDAPDAGALATGTWVRVEMMTDQNGRSRLLVDGVEVTGWTAQGGALASGSMALRAGNLPGGESWFVDDARARKVVDPQPTATLGALDRE